MKKIIIQKLTKTKLNLIIITILIICIFGFLIEGLNNIKMGNSVKMERNNFSRCKHETECNECSQDNYYKKCDKVCYCCDAMNLSENENKCLYQKDN